MTRWARAALTSTVLFLVTLGNPAPLHAANGPSITSLTPNSGAVGASVTIAGSGFGSTQGNQFVFLNANHSEKQQCRHRPTKSAPSL